MVNSLLRPFRRWPSVEAALARIAGQLTAQPADDLDRFVKASMGIASPLPTDIAEPARSPAFASRSAAMFEMRFMKLQAEGRFEEMWEMLALEAQRAWGNREAFVRDMPRMGDDTELLDMQPISITVLDGWTDLRHGRTYSNVAQMVMRYRIRQQWREWTFDREVHLISVDDGWRTLCYPTRSKASEAAGRR